MKIVNEGNAIGVDAEGVAHAAVWTQFLEIAPMQKQVIMIGNSHKNAGIGSLQALQRNARVLHSLPTDFQQHSLLGIHEVCLPRRDAEESGIELGDVGQKAAPFADDLARPAFGIISRVDIPSIWRRLGNGVHAVLQ